MKPKMPTVRSTAGCFTLLAAFCLFMAQGVLAQEIFLRSYWLGAIPGPPPGMSNASIWAGGNESSGTVSGSPHSANGICLAESAIGQITAQTDGYPNASNDLAVLGDSVRTSANVYRYTNFGNGLVAVRAVAWNVVFPGGFARASAVSGPSGPFTYPANAASTYISNDIAEADYVLRARLEVNPADQDAAQQLVLLVDDQILPLEWAGSQAMCYSTFARVQLGPWMVNGTNTETVAVEYARSYFSNACNVFVQFLANPFNADLIEGQNPLVSAAVTNQTAQIVEDFLRNLLEYGQASLTDFQLRSAANFYDPTVTGSAPSQPLLNDIDNTVNQIQMLLLLASPFQSDLPVYTASTVGQIRSLLHDLRRLHQSIILGRITFSTGASVNPSGDPSLNYGEFTTAFVPFFATQTGQNSSFYVAFNLAQLFTSYAISQESAASNDVWQVLNLQYQWTSDEVGLENQYLPQLENLCGTVTDANGNTWADIFTAGLQSGFPTSPGPREALINQLQTNGSGLQFNYAAGTIYQQWQAVESAQTNLIKDTISLNATFTNMLVDTQVANAIYSNQVSLAELILTNGQQISAIDVQAGQDQAQAAMAIAQIDATAAETEAENTGFGQLGGFISGTIGFPGGGVNINPGAITGAMATIANGYDQAAADLETGQVQANLDTQLAALNAQIEHINAFEQAQAVYVQADQTMLNLSANLASLQGQAQAQEVQIQLDAQAVDQERSKLANLMSQVGSLLEQWTRSESLISNNPAFSSNLLVIRDATIQQADDAFTLAQEWAFLAALCFNYEDNCPQDQTKYNFVQTMLSARNASALNLPLEEMETAITLLGAGCKGSIDYNTVQFSLRNNFFQANQSSGTNVTSYEPVLQGGIVLTNAAGSLSAWTNYLASNIITTEGGRALVLSFSTSLDTQLVGSGAYYNPLWNCYEFGGTLYSGQGNNQQQLYGVQVSFVTQGFTFPAGAQAGFDIGLAQNGTSVIRSRGFGNNTSSAPGFRYFNFSPFGADLTASANDLSSANNGTAAFQGRSPANTLWQLSVIANGTGGNNTALLNNLSALTDIQIQFGIQSFTDQTAFTACTSPK
jgi:hypothetical protein